MNLTMCQDDFYVLARANFQHLHLFQKVSKRVLLNRIESSFCVLKLNYFILDQIRPLNQLFLRVDRVTKRVGC